MLAVYPMKSLRAFFSILDNIIYWLLTMVNIKAIKKFYNDNGYIILRDFIF